jgi:hypothetical protein
MEPAGVLVAALLFSLLVFLVYVWSFISGPENGADKEVLYTKYMNAEFHGVPHY